MIISNTPIDKTVEGLWSLLSFVSPGRFKDAWPSHDLGDIDIACLDQLVDVACPHMLKASPYAGSTEEIIFLHPTRIQIELMRLAQ
jgi:hypothetical protein